MDVPGEISFAKPGFCVKVGNSLFDRGRHLRHDCSNTFSEGGVPENPALLVNNERIANSIRIIGPKSS